MIRSKEDLLNLVKERLGDDTSDEALSFVEDVTDTINNYESNSQENWKQRYEDNDKMWREKYRDRFYNGSPKEPEEDIQDIDDTPKRRRFEDLFKEG